MNYNPSIIDGVRVVQLLREDMDLGKGPLNGENWAQGRECPRTCLFSAQAGPAAPLQVGPNNQPRRDTCSPWAPIGFCQRHFRGLGNCRTQGRRPQPGGSPKEEKLLVQNKEKTPLLEWSKSLLKFSPCSRGERGSTGGSLVGFCVEVLKSQGHLLLHPHSGPQWNRSPKFLPTFHRPWMEEGHPKG